MQIQSVPFVVNGGRWIATFAPRDGEHPLVFAYRLGRVGQNGAGPVIVHHFAGVDEIASVFTTDEQWSRRCALDPDVCFWRLDAALRGIDLVRKPSDLL